MSLLHCIDNVMRMGGVRHHLLQTRTSGNYVVDGSTDIASVWIGSSQRTDGGKKIVVDVQLTNICNSGNDHRGCACSFVTLNCMDGCCGTWSLAARIGKVLGSLQQSHANNTNFGGSSGHVQKDIGQVEVMGQSNINRDASNKMWHEGLDGTVASAVEVAQKTFHKAPIGQEDATEAHHVDVICPILAILEENFIALLFGRGSVNMALNKTSVFGHICQLPKDLMSTCFV